MPFNRINEGCKFFGSSYSFRYLEYVANLRVLYLAASLLYSKTFPVVVRYSLLETKRLRILSRMQ